MWMVITDRLMCDSSLSCTSMKYFIFHTEACTMALLLVYVWFFFFFFKAGVGSLWQRVDLKWFGMS